MGHLPGRNNATYRREILERSVNALPWNMTWQSPFVELPYSILKASSHWTNIPCRGRVNSKYWSSHGLLSSVMHIVVADKPGCTEARGMEYFALMCAFLLGKHLLSHRHSAEASPQRRTLDKLQQETSIMWPLDWCCQELFVWGRIH